MITRSALALLAVPLAPALAQAPTSSSETITVIGTTPLLGTGIDANLVPADVSVLGSTALARQGTADLLLSLGTEVAGISFSSPAGNPFQPTLSLNGFVASPQQGTAEGVAVYLNGVRFNNPFGDTVNWDLIPDIAISRVNVEGANPVFGLNALGGSINVRMKDGFSFQGADADASGGSFGTQKYEFEAGQQSGAQSFYAAGRIAHQDGWRDLQSSDLYNAFGDWGLRAGGLETHVQLTLADTALNGPGTSPVQLLAVDPAAQFTAPNAVDNKFVQAAIPVQYRIDDTQSVSGLIYYDYFQQRVVNGNAPNDVPCNDGSGLLCQAPGVYSTTRGGVPIPALFGPSPFAYSELDAQTTNTNGYGAALQYISTAKLLGRDNHFVAGTSFDGADTLFSATGFIGGLTPISRIFIGPGVAIDEPGATVPVRDAITDTRVGVFATDTWNVTPAIALTVSGRYDFAETDLADQNGNALTGNHAHAHFNPGAGATWRFARWGTAYASYAESSRAPTPAELSCASPQAPCSLANFFTGDPNLKQVIAKTWQAGIRGRVPIGPELRLDYDLSGFRTTLEDDIGFVNAVVLNTAYFENIGQTRRQGVNASLRLHGETWSAYANWSYLEPTFQTSYIENAGANPAADANGNITVEPGNTFPALPRNTIKLGFDWEVTQRWAVGADGLLQSGQYLVGDEANLTPKLPGFVTLDVSSKYQLTAHVQLFADVQNALDRRYYTFGTFSPAGSVFLAQAPNTTNPRAYSPGAPIGAFGGVRVTF